jgi:hypothetical protein
MGKLFLNRWIRDIAENPLPGKAEPCWNFTLQGLFAALHQGN